METTPGPEFKSFPLRVKEFFGLKPEQTTKDLVGEIRALSPQDRTEIAQMLTDIGLPTAAGTPAGQ